MVRYPTLNLSALQPFIPQKLKHNIANIPNDGLFLPHPPIIPNINLNPIVHPKISNTSNPIHILNIRIYNLPNDA